VTTRVQELTACSLSALGISVPHTSHSSRAEYLLALIADQVADQQILLDSSFALSTTISYNADRLAEEFGCPLRELLRAFTPALISDRLPPCSRITSDHRILITLVPSTIPERYNSDQSNPTDPTDSEPSHA
jgi:hypothetical protein